MSGSDGLLSFLGRISNITLFLMSSIFLSKKRAPHIWEILHVYQKGINPYNFFKKKKKASYYPVKCTLQNNFRMSVKAPVLK